MLCTERRVRALAGHWNDEPCFDGPRCGDQTAEL